MIPWIKMRVNLLDDPRVGWLAEKLKCNAVTVTGALYVLWSRADQHSTDGILRPYTAANLDTLVGISGFAEALASEEVGWLKIGPSSLQVVEFEKHNGRSAKERAQSGKRVTRHRRSCNGDVTAGPLTEENRIEKNREEGKTGAADAAVSPGAGEKSGRVTFDTWREFLPPELQGSAMRDALRRWTQHRSEIREPLRRTMVEAQAKKFAGWGERKSIEVIEHTIAQGWVGLREPDPPRGARDFQRQVQRPSAVAVREDN